MASPSMGALLAHPAFRPLKSLCLAVAVLKSRAGPSPAPGFPVDSCGRIAFYQPRPVGHPSPFLEKRDLAIVIHAVVPSRLPLTVWNVLYVGLPWKALWKLKLLQDIAALPLER